MTGGQGRAGDLIDKRKSEGFRTSLKIYLNAAVRAADGVEVEWALCRVCELGWRSVRS